MLINKGRACLCVVRPTPVFCCGCCCCCCCCCCVCCCASSAAASAAFLVSSFGAAARHCRYMDYDTYTPVYESRFQFKQLDGWVLAGVTATVTDRFSACGLYSVLGGYNVFAAGASAAKTVTGLPEHTKRACARALLYCVVYSTACVAWRGGPSRRRATRVRIARDAMRCVTAANNSKQ